MKVASTPGYDRVSKVRHHSANGTLITRPPIRSTAPIFVAGAVSGATIVAANPHPPRAERHSLRHVAGRRGQHSALQPLPRSSRHHVRRSPDLERPNRLQVLQLQIDLRRRVRIAPHQRRAQRHRSNVAPRFFHLGQRDRHLHILTAFRLLPRSSLRTQNYQFLQFPQVQIRGTITLTVERRNDQDLHKTAFVDGVVFPAGHYSYAV